jgi:predicted nucleotidyltransferase
MAEPEPTAALGSNFLQMPPFQAMRDASKTTREALDQQLTTKVGRYASEDSSVVTFGSLARGEWTSKSDLDWTYLIDGQANSDHLRIAQEIHGAIKSRQDIFREPGQTGTFGNMAFSHEIIHQIGGQNDTNKNTTQRVLLLLESCAIGKNVQAYERVIRGVINRYLEEDTHLLAHDQKSYRVPRFLLNDIVRFWRTMAVDFASKQRDRAGAGWGLRNAKLRMSRKLIFASGLLICFHVVLDCDLKKDISSHTSTGDDGIKAILVNYIREPVKLTPLEILERTISLVNLSPKVAQQLFTTYADFLNLLSIEESRENLESLRARDSRTDPTFAEVRRISLGFESALDAIFFENAQLAPLTRKYGLF